MAHSFYGPSKANMWMSCPGAMAFPQNQVESRQSDFADEGTAAHHFASLCLTSGEDAQYFIGISYRVNGKDWLCDEDMAAGIQVYVDDVRRRVGAGMLFVEQRVDLQQWLGPDQFGTADAIIVDTAQRRIIVEDLKFGRGEKVEAAENKQLQLYGLGSLAFAELFAEVEDDWEVILVISQPRISQEPSSWPTTVGKLREFGERAGDAVRAAQDAILRFAGKEPDTNWLSPTDKGCRWCAAKAVCPALTAKIHDETRLEFDPITGPEITLPDSDSRLAEAYAVLPMIQNWCRAVESMVYARVTEGAQIYGSDGRPLKLVEGRQGARQWIDSKEAETVLKGVLPDDKVYEQKVITASVAAKLLDRKATKDIWNEYFMPLIRRAPGKPVLALGTDERPAFTGDVTAEFTEILPED